MAIVSQELNWVGCCLEIKCQTPYDRRWRCTSVRFASSLRGGGGLLLLGPNWGGTFKVERRRNRRVGICFAAQESLYETLGVSPTATEKEIKRAYRGLALKFHPDVNKEPGAQEKFLRIKNAYQTLVDSKSRSKYDAGSRTRSNDWDPFQWGQSPKSSRKPSQEEFYGLDDFFRDLQSDLKKRNSARSAKPKSLWEELADIGEEFVEFLEKELNISDDDEEKSTSSSAGKQNDTTERSPRSKPTGTKAPRQEDRTDDRAKVENEIAEIEDMLAKLKKEMGM